MILFKYKENAYEDFNRCKKIYYLTTFKDIKICKAKD